MLQNSTAQRNRVIGKVTDLAGLPIEGATVHFTSKEGDEVKGLTFTEKTGLFHFVLSHLDSTFQITVTAIQYERFAATYRQHNIADTIFIKLTIQAKELKEIRIAVQPPILQKTDTVIYNAQVFLKGTDQTLSALLQNMPGFRVQDDGSVSFQGKRVDRFLLEGDDLFGYDYKKLVNNLSATPIEKIEVFKNYMDETDIWNRASGVREQVVNLRFQKRSLQVYGTAAASFGLPFNRYQINTDITALLSKTKFVAFGGSNTNGRTLQQIQKQQMDAFQSTQLRFRDDFMLRKFEWSDFITDVPMSSNKILEQRVSDNNSHLFDFTGKRIFSPKWQLNTDISFGDEIYRQHLEENQLFLIQDSSFRFQQSNLIRKVNRQFRSSVTVNGKLSKKAQVISESNVNVSLQNHSINGSFQQFLQRHHFNRNAHDVHQKFLFNYVPDSANAFRITVHVKTTELPAIYQVANPLLFDLFPAGNFYSNLQQELSIKNDQVGASFLWLRKLKWATIESNATFLSWNENWSGKISLFNRPDSLFVWKSTDRMRQNLNGYYTTLGSKISFNLFKKIALSTTQRFYLVQANLNYTDTTFFSKRLLYVPQADLRYSISKMSLFQVQYEASPQVAAIEQLAPAAFFQNKEQLFQGSSQFQVATAQKINVSFFSNMMRVTKPGFFLMVNYHQNPMLFIPATRIGGFLQQTEAVPTALQGRFLFASSLVNYYRSKWRTNFQLQVNAGDFLNYSIFQQNLFVQKSRYVQNEIKAGSAFDSWFNFKTGLRWTKSLGRSLPENGITQQQLMDEWRLSLRLISAFSKKWVIDYRFENFIVRNVGRAWFGTSFHDITFRLTPPKMKLDFGIEASNIGNNNEARLVAITPVSEAQTNIRLLPRWILFQVRYKF